jgi:hypothetical protein
MIANARHIDDQPVRTEAVNTALELSDHAASAETKNSIFKLSERRMKKTFLFSN